MEALQPAEYEPSQPSYLLMTSFERPDMYKYSSRSILLHTTPSSAEIALLAAPDGPVIDYMCAQQQIVADTN